MTMRKMPDLNDDAAMMARGRHAAIASARNEACQELRDIAVAAQRLDAEQLDTIIEPLRAVIARVEELARAQRGG